MISGTIKYVAPNGSWGFISRDDKGPKVFVHISEVEKAGLTSIEKGQRWQFSMETDHGERASAARLVFLGYA